MQFISESRERGWGLFPDGWQGQVILYVIDVWQTLQLPVEANYETRITKLLSGAIRNRYEAEGRDWFLTVEDPDWDESGKEKLRTDIRLYPPGSKRHQVCFVFESKCLNAPTSNASKYVGQDGMLRFITGKYGIGLPFAGMLGFVMDGNLTRAHKAVCSAIRKKREPLQLAAESDFRPLSVFPDNKFSGETQHELRDGMLTIYHLLLEVRRK